MNDLTVLLDSGLAIAGRNRNSKDTIRTVLAAFDCVPSGEAVLDTAKQIAKLAGAKICVVHANDLGADISATATDCERMLKDHSAHAHTMLANKIAELRKEGIEVEAIAIDGIPAEVILKEAQDADLFVMGRHWRQKWRLFSRNTVEAVLQAAPCPVVIAGGDPKKSHTGQGLIGENAQIIRD